VIFPSWQDTFLALHSADTVDELWALLITPHGIKSSTALERFDWILRRVGAAVRFRNRDVLYGSRRDR